MSKAKILLVDDEPEIIKQMEWALADQFALISATNGAEALAKVRAEKPELVTLDLGLALHSPTDREGLDVLQELLTINHHLKVVVVTANTQREVAMRAIKMGAFDYYCKPVDLDELRVILQRAVHIRRLEEENESLRSNLERNRAFDNIIGACAGMEAVFDMIRKVADTDVTVLIQGESGTGKELAAKAIHYRSSRRAEPFVIINCGAIPESLLESELFGHEKGAFTGAHIQRKGKFELAEGGTLFLDEVGDIPPALQVKLLRFLQDRIIERIGSRSPIGLDVRVLAATNKDLKTMMADGRFREDLYFRLSVIAFDLPPLRDRGDDTVLLAQNFLQRFAADMKKDIRDFSREAITAIKNHSWPGNVRELENKVKRGVIISQGPLINVHDMGLDGEFRDDPTPSLKDARREMDIKFIKQALKKTGGNISRASRELGVSRVGLHEMMKKYSIR